MKKLVEVMKGRNFWKVVNCMALVVTALNATQCCYWFMHQPEFPAEADKFRKYK